jgi:hypothetical protein
VRPFKVVQSYPWHKADSPAEAAYLLESCARQALAGGYGEQEPRAIFLFVIARPDLSGRGNPHLNLRLKIRGIKGGVQTGYNGNKIDPTHG